jgi:phospholipid transport system substrate-binding protein
MDLIRDMKSNVFGKFLFFILLSLLFASSLWAGEPANRVKAATDKLIAIVSDVSLRSAAKKTQREKKVIEVVDNLFCWDEFSRRVLGTHWYDRTDSEKKEFVTLIRQYIIGSYIDYSTCYSGEKISYLKEKIDGVYGTVTGEVNISNRVYVPVEIRMIKKTGVWQVYDASVAGLSFVEYYRNQINNIITKSSYKELVKRLKQKGYKGLGQIVLTFN